MKDVCLYYEFVFVTEIGRQYLLIIIGNPTAVFIDTEARKLAHLLKNLVFMAMNKA